MVSPVLKASCLLLVSLYLAPASALSLNGITEFAKIVTLNAATDGSVKTLALKPGQQVKAGEILLKLDDARQKAHLDRAEALARALQPDVDIARLEFERAEELYGLDSLSQVDLQNAENKLARAEGQLLAAQAERDSAADDLARTVVKAPFSALVDEVHVVTSQFVNPGVESAPLVTLVQVGPMRAIALLEPSQWNRALVGSKASVSVLGKSFSGRVSYLALRPQKNPGGVTLYELHVEFDSQTTIPAGLPVRIDIEG